MKNEYKKGNNNRNIPLNIQLGGHSPVNQGIQGKVREEHFQ